MLVEVKDKVVSTQIFERKFVCDLSACKGACCIEGDAGAPITRGEIQELDENLELVKPYMREEGIKAIEEKGTHYFDQDNEPVTTLVNGAECAFVFFDDAGIAKCAIEKSFREGKSTFKKPISCSLYPIRVKRFGELTALNYDQWDICQPACECGDKMDVPVYRFLKEPLIQAFGVPFFKELEIIDQEIKSQSK